MPILHIQHSVPAFDTWKQLFDADPIGRKRGGVRRYRIHRGVTDPVMVMVDFEFDAFDAAEDFRQRLHGLWAGPAHTMVQDPQTWIIETVESVEI
jgi:hypothetical protein